VTWEKKAAMGKGTQRTYSDSSCEEMAFIFLYFEKVSLVEIARQYKVLKKDSFEPNNSYARELIHKFLHRHKSRAWFHVDGAEADCDNVTPSREALADKIVSFFPDLKRYRELMAIALQFDVDSIKHERRILIEKSCIYNDDLAQSLEKLGRCNTDLSDDDILNM